MRSFPIALIVMFVSLFASSSVVAEGQTAIRVGWIGPLTGNASALGIDSAPTVKMVFDRINASGGVNGRKLELVIEDDQYSTAKAVAAYKNLVEVQKIKIIFVITYGGFFALANQAERDGVLLLNPLDCDEAIAKLPSNSLCIAKKTEDLGITIAEAAIKDGTTPSALIYFENDPFMGTAAKASQDRFLASQHPIALSSGYAGATVDFRSILIHAKKKGAKSLFFFGYDEMGLAMKQARDMGIEVPFYATGTITSPGYQSSAGAAAEGAKVVHWFAPRGEKYTDFIDAFVKEVGRKPILDISTIPSFDIAEMLGNFLKKATTSSSNTINLNMLKEQFYAVRNYDGLSGKITIDPDGITRCFQNHIYRFERGELRPN